MTKSVLTVGRRRATPKPKPVEIVTINVRPKHKSNAIATQYLGQPGFDNVKACFSQNEKLVLAPQGFQSLGTSCMGYEIRMGEFLPIKHSDWVVTIPGTPFRHAPISDFTFVLSDEDFHARYEKEQL